MNCAGYRSLLHARRKIDCVTDRGIFHPQIGADGTDDDMPYRSPNDIARVGGIPPQILMQISRYFTVRSLIFNATIKVQIAGNTRTYTAILRRNSPRDVQVLNMNWR